MHFNELRLCILFHPLHPGASSATAHGCLLLGTWDYEVLSTWYLVPSTKYQVFGTKYEVPSTWYQVPSTYYGGTKYQALGNPTVSSRSRKSTR